jgi:D-glycero-alpha-D-manno-heptose-7-phosphate kinase
VNRTLPADIQQAGAEAPTGPSESSSVTAFARAPMRISFAGGGTDVAPYPEREGGAVLSAAITRYAFASARLREDDQFNLTSLDLGLTAEGHVSELSELDRRLHLLRAPVERLAGGRGVDLRVQSQAPPGSGLGASSTIVVAVVGALIAAQGRTESRHRVAEQAIELERRDLGLEGGTQDQYAATFGGFNFMEFHPGGVTVNQLRLPSSTIATLEHNLLLCHLGTSRESARIIEDQRRRYEQESGTTAEALGRQKELAVEMKQALLAGELDRFGTLLDEVWRAKQALSPLIATGESLRAYETAKAAGVLGGKITGAGGGGYMLFYSPFERRFEVAQALRDEGFDVLDISIDDMGMESWSHG